MLNPALRGRGAVRPNAQALCDNRGYRRQMTDLFRRAPAGKLLIPTLPEVAERVRQLEVAVAMLEKRSAR